MFAQRKLKYITTCKFITPLVYYYYISIFHLCSGNIYPNSVLLAFGKSITYLKTESCYTDKE